MKSRKNKKQLNKTKQKLGGYKKYRGEINQDGKPINIDWPMDVTKTENQIQFRENVELYIPLAIRPILDDLKSQTALILKWDTIDGHFHQWCTGKTIRSEFTPFGNNETHKSCKNNNSWEKCTEKFGPHTMFFCFKEEFDLRMKEILSQYNNDELDNEDIRYIKNMLLGYNNNNEQIATIIECNYTDLLRPCENKTILNNSCNTPPEQYTPKLTNIINNNQGYPFTAKGYTYNILGSETNKYGVTEVILPQGPNIKIHSTRAISEENYFKYLKQSIQDSSSVD